MNFNTLESFINPELIKDLGSIDTYIRLTIDSETPLLKEIPLYLLDLGGKRIRPALTIICARLFGLKSVTQELLDICAGIELIHMATLLHDDIIDNAPTRRNKVSAFKKFGLANTLLSGNYLFVKAFGLCARLDNYIIQETERACIDLTEGEMLESCSDFEVSQALNISRKKTGSLFRLSASSGGFIATEDRIKAEKLGNIGEALGVAFQISDDILDVTPDNIKFGKVIGTDIREKKPSLINSIWHNRGSVLSTQVLFREMDELDQELLNTSITEINELGIPEEARQIGLGFIDSARQELHELREMSGTLDETSSTMLKSAFEFATNRLA